MAALFGLARKISEEKFRALLESLPRDYELLSWEMKPEYTSYSEDEHFMKTVHTGCVEITLSLRRKTIADDLNSIDEILKEADEKAG